MSLFTADAILFGSEAQEIARGTLELHAFFERMLTQPMTISWTWRTLLVGQNGDTIWFVGPAALLVQDDTVGEQVYPYRLSGVLTRQPGREWLFSLFNGSEPAVR
jgi:ketosteroid isomerase-like protein